MSFTGCVEDSVINYVSYRTYILEFEEILGNIFKYNASVNFYMFHGGTNFGFMNGANHIDAKTVPMFPFYAPDVTSYGTYTNLICKLYTNEKNIETYSFPLQITMRPLQKMGLIPKNMIRRQK